ncbi:hypothetical protein JTB14_004928 [Gonioctena quinquepunctata]|nr:hypothetical protein JTB14_004928 [Gonioctena quinquepunctata]
MCRQVAIAPENRNLQRIVWSTDSSEAIKHYTLNTVTYGCASSSFLACRSVVQAAIDNEQKYPAASEIIKNCFYVDDLICGAPSIEEAIILKDQINQILLESKFTLRKWTSNKAEVVIDENSHHSDDTYVLPGNENIKTLVQLKNTSINSRKIKSRMEEANSNGKLQEENPADRKCVLKRIFFCWLLPYFVMGFKRELTEDDMYQNRKKHDSVELGDRLEAAWRYQVKHKKKPSFFKALCSMFLCKYLMLCIVMFLVEAIRFLQPLLISTLLKYFDDNLVEENRNRAYTYSGIIVLTLFANVIFLHYTQLQMMEIGMKIRVASCSLIYRKALKLNKSALAETTVGQMVNLLSNDVGRFDNAMHFMHYLVLGPLGAIAVIYLSYMSLGYTGPIGAIFLLLTVSIQSWLGKKVSQYRLNTAIRTDERVRLMNEIISGIQVIKMYAWEKSFARLAKDARSKEMKYINLASIIRAILMSCALGLNRFAVFLCILVYILTGHTVNSSYIFTMTSFYRLLGSVTMFFPKAISLGSEMFTSMERIRTFLMYDELLPEASEFTAINRAFQGDENVTVQLKKRKIIAGVNMVNASVKWLESSPENNLEDITMNATSGDLVAIVGSVGSGKTTLLHLILEELIPETGMVTVQGVVSYASQEAWLFGGSVRQNIIFGLEFEQKKYDEVIRVCALERDFTLFPHGDRTLVGERGITLSGGQRARVNLARAIYKEADIYLLDDPLSAVDTHVGKQLFDQCISGYLRNKCVILVTHQLQYLKNVKTIYLLDHGRVQVSGSYEAIRKSDTKFYKMLASLDEEGDEKLTDEKRGEDETSEDNEQQVLQREEKGKGSISWHVYGSYMRASGSFWKVFFLSLGFLISQAMDSGADYFVTLWVNVKQWQSRKYNTEIGNDTKPLTSAEMFYGEWFLTPMYTGNETLIYYSILVVLTVVIIFSRSVLFYRWCLTASTTLHNKMFDNIVYSPMRFFNINPSGRILNRFSKDIGTLDESLPMTLLDTIQIGLNVLAICIVIGSLSLWILIPTVLIGFLFYWYRIVFLKTSRDVKRVESVARSPIFTHLAASLQGLTTIRAFGAQKILRKEFDNYQNLHSAAFYMYLSVTKTFGFWLDLHCVIYIALVLVALLFVKSETFGGNVGLALTQAMALTGMFQFGMRQWSELENQMTSVERVQEYADLEHEKEGDVKEPPKDWPQNGNVEFRNLYLQYSPDHPHVLRDLSFTITKQEKVGIVGRTGAGKSSLIQALFRLAEIQGGIFIDDIDTKTVELQKLRSKISIIPQEPVLFSGTLRRNLDPFDEYDDKQLWNALDEVELKAAVSDLRLGLDSKMAEGGSNFSVGQRQLFCLARAILRNNKILVLDEATANVDPHTDELIQKTIRKKFDKCTVLTIAHRLHTIMDSDKVLVMDSGQKVEFDHPHILLQNENGIFYSLVMQTAPNCEELGFHERNYLFFFHWIEINRTLMNGVDELR